LIIIDPEAGKIKDSIFGNYKDKIYSISHKFSDEAIKNLEEIK